MRKGGEGRTYSFIIWRKSTLSPSPWYLPGLLSRRQTLGTFQAEKLKPITHTARPRMKSRKPGIWQEGKRSKTGNWLGQACGKSRQPNKPGMEVPHTTASACTPPARSSLQLGGFTSEELCQRLPREAQSEHVLPGEVKEEVQVALWKHYPWEERGRQPQPVALSSVEGNSTARNRYCSPKAARGKTQIRWLHSLEIIEAVSFLVSCYWNALRSTHFKMLIRNDLKIMELKSVKKDMEVD